MTCLSKLLGPAGSCLIHLGNIKNNVGFWILFLFCFPKKIQLTCLLKNSISTCSYINLGDAGHELGVTSVLVHLPCHPRHSPCSSVQHPVTLGEESSPEAAPLTAGVPFPKAGVQSPGWPRALHCCSLPREGCSHRGRAVELSPAGLPNCNCT